MDITALEGYLGTGGIEILKLQFTNGSTVHRVGPLATELLDIKLVCSHANLLVGVEAHADVAMLDLGVLLQPLDGG